MVRRTALVLLAALALTACNSELPGFDDIPLIGGGTEDATEPDGDPDPTDVDGTDPDPEATDDPGGAQQPPPGQSPTVAPSPQPPPAALTPADDRAAVGANGRAILRGDRPRLVIEIDVQSGARADDAAVQHTVDTLRQVTDKADIRVVSGTTFTSDRRSWSTADLRAAAAAHRTTATTDAEVSIHVLYVRGAHVDDSGNRTNAIGIAYSASTMALFPDRWSDLTGVLLSSRAIERAVLLHEVGHLLGLVNLTYQSEIDHEDPDHPGHSRHRDSVMYHAVETTLIGQVFTGAPPDRFHRDDLADLDGLRTGRY